MLKKSFLSFCLIAITAIMFNVNSVQAQSSFGIRAGLNFAKVTDDTDTEMESRTGFMAGVFYQYQFDNSYLAIQPELLYTQKGFTGEAIAMGQVIDVTYKLDYIQVPVLLEANFTTSGAVTPHVYMGPYLAFLVSEEVEAEVNGKTESGEVDLVKGTDFGATFGAGIGFGSFEVGVRYSLSLTNISDVGGEGKNRVVSITAGYRF